jgi:hypothetical protein
MKDEPRISYGKMAKRAGQKRYLSSSYVDGSDDVLWLRDPTGRREVSFVYDSARHRRGFQPGSRFENQAQTATISKFQKGKQQEGTMSM